MAKRKSHADVMAELRKENGDMVAELHKLAAERELDPLETRVLMLECMVHYLSHVLADFVALVEPDDLTEMPRSEKTEYGIEDHLHGGLAYALDFLEHDINPHIDQARSWFS